MRTEKEMDESTLESELAYRTFVIYPTQDRINIKRKVDKEVLHASIGFDWINLGFFVEDDEGVSSIKSFNEFLLGQFSSSLLRSSVVTHLVPLKGSSTVPFHGLRFACFPLQSIHRADHSSGP